MAGGKLEVQIGADKTDFDKKIKEVEYDIKELSKIKLERLKLGLDTSEINAQIKDAKNNLNSLKSTVKDAGGSFNNLKTGAVNGGNALMQFSRIAQDAPFGIMGIGNNITATVEAFANLKNQAGSTGGALKAVGASILGSGGILLGVSLLTTGLTYLAQSGLSLEDVFNKLIGNTNAYGEALKSAFAEAYADKGVLNVIENVNQLKNEVELAKNGFLSKTEVVKHYNETMGKTTGIVKDLDGVEQQLVKNGDAYIKMTLYKAVANAANAEAAKKMLESEQNQNKESSKFIGTLGYLKEGVKALTNVWTIYNINDRLTTAGEKNKKDAINETNKAINANIAIAKKYTQASAAIAKANQFNYFGNNEPSKTKTFNTPQVSGIGQTIVPAPLFDLNQTRVFNGQVDEFGNKIKELPGIIKASLPQVTNTLSVETAKMLILLQEFNDAANDLILNSIANTFSNLGNAIGEALATGGDVLSAIGQTIIGAFANFLSSMGDLLIKYGTLAVIKGKLDLAIAAGGPISIAAGVAAIAVGVALKAAGAAIGSFASSGGRVGSSAGGGANNNNSNVTSSTFSAREGGGTVVFEIAGTKLIGVLSNTINANRRLGGQLGIG